jgi:phospholipid/cholesterol/gamma-HCH transport system ATP-binding protein
LLHRFQGYSVIYKREVLEKNITKKTGADNNEPVIEIKDLCKSFGDNDVLKKFTLSIFPGENLVVMGKSGIGKTVLIKCIIGLIKPDSGLLKVFGKDIDKLSKKQLDEMRMRIGFVFQNSALYDSMTVRENLEFPLRRHTLKKMKGSMEQNVREALKNVGLEKAIDLMPAELSGGMRKRIGIARSLILKPEVVLYDEPTTGLDPITSSEITNLIKDLQEKYQTTSVIITHDVELAEKAANRIVFLIDGIAYMQGTFEEVSKTDDTKVKPFFER